MFKLAILLLLLTLSATLAAAQGTNNKPTTKTVRLHIDGFSKSKSGAI